ncbi:MAG: rhodanese [Gammaproteobacteria bacterium]|jgi:tRNA nucleotidyltransferase (CCA-adding enzyme)
MNVYLVGGAVRDELLGLPVRERDWVVVGATEAEVAAAGFRRVDAAFPVYLHPETGEEYALARRETKTGPGYKGFVVEAGPDVTLEEDLARRDLTINAMARDAAGAIHDPFGGRADLDAGLLRHVTPAFVEDPVRVLRAARFAAVLGRWGFRVAHATHGLMKCMAAGEDLRHVAPARLWREMRGALAAEQPWRFFEVLAACGALPRLLPELAGHLPPRAPHVGEDPPAALQNLRRIASSDSELDARFAALMLGPVLAGLDVQRLRQELPADGVCYDRLAHCREVCQALPALAQAQPVALVAFLNRQRAFSRPERLERSLRVCVTVCGEPLAGAAARVRGALAAARGVDAAALAADGLRGLALRHALDVRRAAAVDAAAAVADS